MSHDALGLTPGWLTDLAGESLGTEIPLAGRRFDQIEDSRER